ncbi:unnamed protein product [Closterium sp. Naga37s-1]|nr:unnamed protein product [Closterium sp. Naga37s-1]
MAHRNLLSAMYGDGTVPKSPDKGNTNEGSPDKGSPSKGSPSTSTGSASEAPSKGTTSEAPSMQVATEVAVGGLRLTFSKQRCVSVPKKAARQRNVKVWWQGRAGSSNGGSGYGGYGGHSSYGGPGSKARGVPGVACEQIQFFGGSGCQGKEVDSMVNPGTTAAAKVPSSEKKISKWASVASVASVLCNTGASCADPVS